MIVRTLEDAVAGPREVSTDDWTSRRLLLRDDGMGFSLHDTIIKAGANLSMHYRHHLEAVYCIEGRGRITEEATGESHTIRPGTLYALDAHDKHVLTAETDMRFVCVFNPPVTGREVHDANGAYPSQGVAETGA
ncbi:MAG: ectoine synthase [Polyangiales bacterium]